MGWLLIILVLIPQTVNAECAWVLWMRKIDLDSSGRIQRNENWAPNSVFDTKKECLEEMTKNHQLFKKLETKDSPLILEYPGSSKNRIAMRFVYPSDPLKETTLKIECWPSEIQPK
jgi:hypothetical protein